MKLVLLYLPLIAQRFTAAFASSTCLPKTVDFIVTKGDATLAAMEDDVRAHLKKVNITVNTKFLDKADFNKASTDGNFHLVFSETWGPPYDPHAFAASWKSPDEAHYAALKGMRNPTQAQLSADISNVLTVASEQDRQTKWKSILSSLHAQAIDLPFSGKRMPTVLGKRLSGYVDGQQQYEYRVDTLQVLSGSKTITVVPGSQTGLFETVGRLDPHSYRPNEFFANNWVYEGLVSYGEDGVIVPALATSWIIINKAGGGQEYRFTLRQGVKFHDNEDWNCAAAKLNFDHILAVPMAKSYHDWYDLPAVVDGWSCASTYEFVMTTKSKYYPLLQELSFIRPTRMLSPAMFADGATTNALTRNSCPVGTGASAATVTGGGQTVTCAGVKGIAGTGPFKYTRTEANGDVQFDKNAVHWRAVPQVDTIICKKMASADAVFSALKAGTLDAVLGAGVLKPADLKTIQTTHADKFSVFLGPPIMNRFIIMNANKAPTSDLNLRRVIMHAVDKAAIIDKELLGFASPVDSLFPKNAPYCGIDLTPKWDYDMEKAQMLGCPKTCEMKTVEFVVQKGDATLAAIEDDVRADLEKVNIKVTTKLLEKADFNKASTDGNFHLVFSETWGPPYDPHAFAASWKSADEAHYAALKGMKNPTQAELAKDISDVLTVTSEADRQKKWKGILSSLHQQAIDVPFSGKRMPTVMASRLTGYVAGQQQYDYPVWTWQVLSGSKTVTVVPGAQTGLFKTIGRLDPHSYRPNEFFANNWVYEGLVSYGANGMIEPALATSWIIVNKAGGGQEYRFTLRQGVKFHDGENWNCSVAKLNFDHILAVPMAKSYHNWYDLPKVVDGWNCASTYEFVMTTKSKYYPLLQELTFIRPTRMLSPAMFADGATTNPLTRNSCPVGTGASAATHTGGGQTVTCAGVKGIAGTGPFKYTKTETNGDVQFDRNTLHWRAVPKVETIICKVYADADAVMSALVAGTLDAVIGAGVLKPADLKKIQTTHTDKFSVFLGPPIMNRFIIINANKAPTNDINLRRVIIHAVNKAAIIEKELYGLASPVDALFPKNAPYCGVDLTPRWDYDYEKASLLSCPSDTYYNPAVEPITVLVDKLIPNPVPNPVPGKPVPVPVPSPGPSSGSSDKKEGISIAVVIVIIVCAVVLMIAIGAAFYVYGKRKGSDEERLLRVTPTAQTPASSKIGAP